VCRMHSMTALPNELLLRVLARAMMDDDGEKRWRAGRAVSRRWRALHDAACTRLRLRDGVTDAGMHAQCALLPALKTLNLRGVGLRA
jgi:hypothetical protein